jgi:competence protein ComEC
MTPRSLGHRAPLLWLVLPFAGGLVAGKTGLDAAPLALLAGALGAAGFAVWAARRESWSWGAAICAAMFLAGAASYILHRQRLPAWDALPPREARLTLRLERVFPQIDAKRAAGLAKVVTVDDHLRELAGQPVYFSLNLRKGESAPLRSAVVSAVGVIVALPRDPPANSFDAYLAGSGVNFRLTRGRVLAEVAPPSAYRRFCHTAAARFSEILGTGLAQKRPELAGVLRAMLLGRKHELSDEQDSLFMHSGTMHLFAISGLHIGVIAVGLQGLLALLRLPRPVRFAVSLAALWLYVDITGAAPSAVRAFVMVALLQASLVLRVPANPWSALTASALAILLVRPMQLFSASFQLSYGIVAALLLLGLPLADRWQAAWTPFAVRPKAAWAWHHHARAGLWRAGSGALAIGVASALVSALGGVAFFNLLTPGALVANLALIPAASMAILAGMLSLLAGLAGWPAGSDFFNHAAGAVLWAMDASIRAFVQWPGVWHQAQFTAAWIGPVALAGLVASLIAGYGSGWRGWSRWYWPPFAVVALALILGVKFG